MMKNLACWNITNKKKQYQQTVEWFEVIEKVVPPRVSKLNHSVMNKKQRDQVQFSAENRL